MFARRYRLPAHIRFPYRNTIVTADYLIKLAPNDLPYSRFGFIIGKALDKRSTHRNRIKRQLRSCIEELQSGIVTGYDMLFLLKRGIMDKDRTQMFEELRKVFEKNNLLIH
jgi:ribonuclease P protein component